MLIGHSGAGPLLAAVADRLESDVHGFVFVDAGLPTPGRSWLETAPTELSDRLAGMARGGWLPPWSQWWQPSELTALIAEAEVRARFVAGCRPLPVGMFQEVLPAAPRWQEHPGAYVCLSDAYRDQADRARGLGWPVVDLDSNHLAVLTDAESIIGPLLHLVAGVQG